MKQNSLADSEICLEKKEIFINAMFISFLSFPMHEFGLTEEKKNKKKFKWINFIASLFLQLQRKIRVLVSHFSHLLVLVSKWSYKYYEDSTMSVQFEFLFETYFIREKC